MLLLRFPHLLPSPGLFHIHGGHWALSLLLNELTNFGHEFTRYGGEFEKLAAISEDIYPPFSFAALVLIGRTIPI